MLAIELVSLGLGAVVRLMFLEVERSKERELAREESGDASLPPLQSGGFGFAADRAGPTEDRPRRRGGTPRLARTESGKLYGPVPPWFYGATGRALRSPEAP
jgi:hypothetical protein